MDKVRIAVAGCGSVSGHYLAHLRECAHVEVVGACDIIESRFRERMAEFEIPRGFVSADEMIDTLEFDLLLNTTSMPPHYAINKKALSAGKHVFSEKPFAQTYADGRELLDLARGKGLRLWGAPNVVTSPQFNFQLRVLAQFQ